MGNPLVRRLMVGVACSALGSGLTMPFFYVYFAQVRGIPGPTVGLLFAWMGLVSFLGAPLGGTLIDRFGPRVVMIVGLIVEACAVGSMAPTTAPPTVTRAEVTRWSSTRISLR